MAISINLNDSLYLSTKLHLLIFYKALIEQAGEDFFRYSEYGLVLPEQEQELDCVYKVLKKLKTHYTFWISRVWQSTIET